MTVITTRLTVTPEGTISAAARLPAGEHSAAITVTQRTTRDAHKRPTMEDFPIDRGPWDNMMSLRREDMHGDDGR